MANILLVSTPYTINYLNSKIPSVHLGLAYLSGFLKYSGHKVKIIDANAQQTNYEEMYNTAFNYDVIGFSIYSTNLISTKQAIKKLRVNGYSGHITLGGHLVSLCPQHLLEIPGANSIVIGEGEITLNDLIYSIKNKMPI
ncbi:MAG: cobalamin-dependent protein, partial [Promethearchaeota archaeon]